MVNNWLQTHTINELRAAKQHDSQDQIAQGGADIALHVIDCRRRSIVRLPPRGQYVTLSYVWGQYSVDASPSDPEECRKGTIPLQVPATIEDSIFVCLTLGYRYLWVDRYCIPQADLEERCRQIQQMGTIYHNSVLTIVACAGGDPGYGLPGVVKPRQQYPTLFIDGAGYLQKTPSVTDIHASAWAARGWTYQESLLSSARLYFTDQQLYFETNKSLECEWGSLAGSNTTTGENWIFSQNAWLARPENIYRSIADFSSRSLTLVSDTLNAVLGVLAAFDHKFQVGHLCGIPFMKNRPISTVEGPVVSSLTLQFSLLFKTEEGSCRIKDFPSWSWAGWTGYKYWAYDLERTETSFSDTCVAVEHASGHIMAWEEYRSKYDILKHNSDDRIKFVHVEAYIIPIADVRGDTVGKGIVQAFAPISLGLPNGAYLRFHLHSHVPAWINERALQDPELYALLAFRPDSEKRNKDIRCLVIRDMGTHWERVDVHIGCCVDRNGKTASFEFCPGMLRTIRLG
ncbi:tol protein [Stagonosporopsis vannaccii]|nr:tol protein [Stagonosporopsis vannaccii]